MITIKIEMGICAQCFGATKRQLCAQSLSPRFATWPIAFQPAAAPFSADAPEVALSSLRSSHAKSALHACNATSTCIRVVFLTLQHLFLVRLIGTRSVVLTPFLLPCVGRAHTVLASLRASRSQCFDRVLMDVLHTHTHSHTLIRMNPSNKHLWHGLLYDDRFNRRVECMIALAICRRFVDDVAFTCECVLIDDHGAVCVNCPCNTGKQSSKHDVVRYIGAIILLLLTFCLCFR